MPRLHVLAIATLAVLGAACGGDSDETTNTIGDTTVANTASTTGTDAGVRLVDAPAAAAALEPGVVLLDVRTAEEFGEAHVAGATLIDFYGQDFADEIGALDRDASYVVYCRSGNRSGQTVDLMEQLGFTDVRDVDGGVLAWAEAGLPLVTP